MSQRTLRKPKIQPKRSAARAQTRPKKSRFVAAGESKGSGTSKTTARKDGEIFFGIVAAVGTNIDLVLTALTASLTQVGYNSSLIRLSDLITKLMGKNERPDVFWDERISHRMNWGDRLRKRTERNDALALLGVGKVKRIRQKAVGRRKAILPRHAFIFRSLKHPDEVTALRRIYGSGFYLIAAYSPSLDRKEFLAKQIAESRNEFPHDRQYERAENLIQRDAEEFGLGHGQHFRRTFHRADVFVDASDAEETHKSIQRFVDLTLGHPFHTPSRAEYAMFHAQASALRSAELGRQVGSAIANHDGDIVAVGTNEVPKAGGGLYWAGDNPDKREFTLGSDSNDHHKRRLVADTLKRLKDSGWLSDKKSQLTLESLTQSALMGKKVLFPRGSEIGSLIEYGRAVHAEMAALMDAARRGIAVSGCSMFVTTFPCHLCARHIVAAGITKLYFIEPYAKSLTAELYPDSIAVENADPQRKQVRFEPFVGVAPRRYMEFFAMPDRKDDYGNILPFDAENASPRCSPDPRIYLDNEEREVGFIMNVLEGKRLVVQNTPTRKRPRR